MPRGRSFCFTINNFSTEDWDALKLFECRYICFSHEVEPLTGTHHNIQGYCSFANPRSFAGVADSLRSRCGGRRPHVEVAKGTAQQNRDYTKAEGKFTFGSPDGKVLPLAFFEKGDMLSQGKRSDITELSQKVADGISLVQIAKECKKIT